MTPILSAGTWSRTRLAAVSAALGVVAGTACRGGGDVTDKKIINACFAGMMGCAFLANIIVLINMIVSHDTHYVGTALAAVAFSLFAVMHYVDKAMIVE